MFKAKKGFVASDELWGLLIVTLFFVILLLVFSVGKVLGLWKSQKQVEASLQDFTADYNLNQFLSIPMEENKNMADLINERYLKNDDRKISEIAQQFFRDSYTLKGLDYDIIIGEKSINYVDFVNIFTSSEILIPLTTKEPVIVELIVGEMRIITVGPK